MIDRTSEHDTIESRSHMLAGFCGVLLVKGVFAFMVPVACGLWVLSRAPSNARPRQDWAAWTGLALILGGGVFERLRDSLAEEA
jgi:hypothetical protein